MLRLQNLTIGYKGNVIATDVSAELQSGKLTCLLGVNGCGKSTLLRTMCGFLPPLGGDVLIGNDNLNALTASEKSRKISIVLTHNEEARGMTVWDVVAMGRSPYTGFWGRLSDEDKRIIKESLDMVGISETENGHSGTSAFINRRITEISDGERQKVMIAKAIAQQTPVILLDEPTAFLDYPSKRRMFGLLTQVARDLNKAILLSTHDIDHAKRFGDLAWMMDEGQLRCSSFEELIAEKPDFFSSKEV
ncbi:MAG: ABC transporter ATP-binding protein [Prevotella sp.]|nr:ABC transporter ATP-binding protein [Prevotella sp.]